MDIWGFIFFVGCFFGWLLVFWLGFFLIGIFFGWLVFKVQLFRNSVNDSLIYLFDEASLC